MNELIKQFGKQAEDYAYQNEEHWGPGPDWLTLFKEKFAELIVADCIRIIYEQERIPEGFLYPKAAHQHELAIKDYFGLQ